MRLALVLAIVVSIVILQGVLPISAYASSYTVAGNDAKIRQYYRMSDKAFERHDIKTILSRIDSKAVYIDCSGNHYSKLDWGESLRKTFRDSTNILSKSSISILTIHNSKAAVLCYSTLVIIQYNHSVHHELHFIVDDKTEDYWTLTRGRWLIRKSICLAMQRRVKIVP